MPQVRIFQYVFFVLKYFPKDEGVARALYMAWKAYGKDEAEVCMVVQKGEKNKFDQLHLQYLLQQHYGVSTVRQTLDELELAVVDPVTHCLRINGVETAIVYFRAGYGPDDYPSAAQWQVRKKIELSQAVKIPSVSWQLSGAKKIQQLLAQKEILERFSPKNSKLGQSFVGLFEVTEQTVAMALAQPDAYVLKPQREGGGNNYYGAEMVEKLKKLNKNEFPAFILMELIVSSPVENTIVRNHKLHTGQCVAELGVYSAFVIDAAKKQILNDSCGYLLRSKFAHINETGVSAGFGALDSVQLTK
jgi:glutathione synthase